MEELPQRIAPLPYSLRWLSSRFRGCWRQFNKKGRFLLVVSLVLFASLVFKFPVWWFFGIYHYCVGYFRASALDITLQESCALLREVNGRPLWNLSFRDYLRWNRCLGNDAGFNHQGQLHMAALELLIYIFTFAGMIPYGFYIYLGVLTFIWVIFPRIFRYISNLIVLFFTTAWTVAFTVVVLVVVSYISGYLILVVLVLIVITVVLFMTQSWTREHGFLARRAVARFSVFVFIYHQCEYMVYWVWGVWIAVREEPWGRVTCVHARQCQCNARSERLEFMAETTRINTELRIDHLRAEIATRDRELDTLRTEITELERKRNNYQCVVQLGRINNDNSNCLNCSGTDLSLALEHARSQIGLLLMEADNAKSSRLAEIASYKATIDKLRAQVNYAGGAVQDRSQTLAELENARSKIRALERTVKEIAYTGSELRQSLAREKETHSEKCQNQAVCTRKILQLQVERDQFKHYQHDNDVMARQAAKAIGGLQDSDVAHITTRSYLTEMTTKFLELKARGTPGLSTTDLQVDIVHRNYAEQTAIKDRLEREVERLGGDVEAIRMGRDTTRPQEWRVEILTFEQNHYRVFQIYEDLTQTVVNLEHLLMAHAPAVVPIWQPEPARNDATKWLESAPPSEMQLSKHYATINQIINPTSPHESALKEKLVMRECQRWFNRGSQLLKIFTRVAQDAHTTQIINLEQASHIDGILSQAHRVLKTTFYGILMETCMLKRDDTERQPSDREKKRFKIYTAMQESITALTDSIRGNQRMPPPWPTLPPAKNVPIGRADDLATHLVVQEIITLEGRVRQLRKFMEDYSMPGTINGPPQVQIQRDNGRSAKIWLECVAARTYSDFTLCHWMIWKAQKPVHKIGDDGLPIFNDRREPVFLPPPQTESKLLPLITWDDFIITIQLKNAEVKQLDPDKIPEDLVPRVEMDPVLGPRIGFVPKSQYDNNSKNSQQVASNNDSNDDSGDARKKITARRRYDEYCDRVQQLSNHCRDWAIASNMRMPQKKQLPKNASLETITKTIADQDEKVKIWSGLITGHGRQIPKWPKAGGPMKPKLR